MSEKFVNYLKKNNVILEEDKDIYCFGIQQLKKFFIGLATDIFIGVIFDMVWECILFSIMYIPLRQYAGGYHAPNPQICYALSIVLICNSLAIIRYVEINTVIAIVLLFLALGMIFRKAPVESKNNLLNAKEKHVFRKKACMIGSIESLMCIILFVFAYIVAAKCILTAIIMSALLLLFSDKDNKAVHID